MMKKSIIVLLLLLGVAFAEEDIFTPEMFEVAPVRKVVIIESEPEQQEQVIRQEIVSSKEEKSSFTQLTAELGFGLYKIDVGLHNKSVSRSYSLNVGLDSSVMWKSAKNKYNNYISGTYARNLWGLDDKLEVKLIKQGTSLVSNDKSFLNAGKDFAWQDVDGRDLGAHFDLAFFGQSGAGKDINSFDFSLGAKMKNTISEGGAEFSLDFARNSYASDSIFSIVPAVICSTKGDKLSTSKLGLSLPWIMGNKSALLIQPYYFYSKIMDSSTEFSFVYDPKVKVASIKNDVMKDSFIQNDTNPDAQTSFIGMSFMLDKKISSDLVINGELRIDDLNDMIVYQDMDGDKLLELANLDHAMITSFVLGSEYRYDPKIRFVLNAAFNLYSSKDDVPYLPALNADTKMIYLYDKNTELSAQLDISSSSKATVVGGTSPGYTLFNLKAERYFSKTFSGFIGVNNILNNKIEYYKDIEERGLALKFGAQLTI